MALIVVRRPVLVTVAVDYYMPAYPGLINTLTWQTGDHVPGLPRVQRFLDHWRREIRAVIARVAVAHCEEGRLEPVSEWLTL